MTKEKTVKAAENDRWAVFFPPQGDSTQLLVACGAADYQASRIAHAVEDADASLLNLNITSMDRGYGRVVVALRVGHRNPEAVARSLERYGYEVLQTESPLSADDTLRRRYDELMHYLSM